MLSYRHAFHAGNHADVFKHITLTLILESLKQKDKAFIYLDSHAGAGYYDLQADWAQKTGEYQQGIARLWQTREAWPQLTPYFQAIQALNDDTTLRYYPGSPAFAQALLREQDRLALCELHSKEFELLRSNMKRDKRVALHHRDGFEALTALLPPTPRRGVLLIDPPYEQSDEYRRVSDSVAKALKRWAGGCYAIWYPLLAKNRDQSRNLLKALSKLPAAGGLLAMELKVQAQDSTLGMYGSGMAIINPPWQLDEKMRQILPSLSKQLSTTTHHQWSVEWLVAAK